MLAVGEYANDQGCSLPNPVFINWEYFRPRFKIEWFIKLKKWRYLVQRVRALWCRIKYNPKSIHPAPREELGSRGGGVDDSLYNAMPRSTVGMTSATWMSTATTTIGMITGGLWAFATILISLPINRWESFVLAYEALAEEAFASCPFQPPSILPTSFNLMDKARYFLSFKDFVSQRINKNILAVSSFWIALLT